MKVKEGDVLKCQCEDCGLEITVNKTCASDACSHEECDLEAVCCDKPLVLKEKKGCCGG
jgi:TusA-related sulfurtransferase